MTNFTDPRMAYDAPAVTIPAVLANTLLRYCEELTDNIADYSYISDIRRARDELSQCIEQSTQISDGIIFGGH